MSSTELFYLDEDGNKQDAELHDAILGDDTPHEPSIKRHIARLVAAGLEESAARSLFYPDEEINEAVALTMSREAAESLSKDE